MSMESPSVKIAIELNDAGLILVQGDVANPPSPGVAVWDGHDLFCGLRCLEPVPPAPSGCE